MHPILASNKTESMCSQPKNTTITKSMETGWVHNFYHDTNYHKKAKRPLHHVPKPRTTSSDRAKLPNVPRRTRIQHNFFLLYLEPIDGHHIGTCLNENLGSTYSEVWVADLHAPTKNVEPSHPFIVRCFHGIQAPNGMLWQ